jgi:hypothetical protein
MMFRCVARGCAVALAIGASALAAQTDPLARVRAEYGPAVVTRIEAIIDDAAGDGVPRSLLQEKAVEGAAKRMAAGIVVDAVTVYADELRGAVELLGRNADPVDLEKAADSMRHGVDRRVVGDLARRHPDDFAIFLQAIDDLLHTGVELDVAEGMVSDAASRGLNAQDVLTLSSTVRRLVRDGSSPFEAASSIRQSIRSGRMTIPPPSASPAGGIPLGTVGRRIPPPPPPITPLG